MATNAFLSVSQSPYPLCGLYCGVLPGTPHHVPRVGV